MYDPPILIASDNPGHLNMEVATTHAENKKKNLSEPILKSFPITAKWISVANPSAELVFCRIDRKSMITFISLSVVLGVFVLACGICIFIRKGGTYLSITADSELALYVDGRQMRLNKSTTTYEGEKVEIKGKKQVFAAKVRNQFKGRHPRLMIFSDVRFVSTGSHWKCTGQQPTDDRWTSIGRVSFSLYQTLNLDTGNRAVKNLGFFLRFTVNTVHVKYERCDDLMVKVAWCCFAVIGYKDEEMAHAVVYGTNLVPDKRRVVVGMETSALWIGLKDRSVNTMYCRVDS
ncbi:hypothetical protein HELRODRAFT_172861 [Helobdella robusta]|uniref:Uncharacterized protein n=1 Tax=Helobdella robusta TaxID=6412 RepID=T1F612_HELRO|nr:hypothetical protein HELRODRAFT_172861 [Helobdella robusta]ESO04475.1 hypothetical protein HELRODRAFT_172861 [Helobdella robusta]